MTRCKCHRLASADANITLVMECGIHAGSEAIVVSMTVVRDIDRVASRLHAMTYTLTLALMHCLLI